MSDFYERYWKRNVDTDGIAQTPPEWRPHDLRRVLGFIAPFARGRVLDVGCGEGFFTSRLLSLDGIRDVTGVDVSKTAIALAKTAYPTIKFSVSLADQLPFHDSSYDLVTLIDVLEHLIDVSGVFREIHRVLKPGGRVVITTSDFNWIKKILVATFFWDKYFYPTNPHIRFFTKATIAKELHKANFVVVRYAWNDSYAGLMPKGQIVVAQKQAAPLKAQT